MAHVCNPCPKGFISTSAESSSCVPCPPGSYSDLTNSTSCTLCPMHTFLPTAGGISLLQCLPCRAWVGGSITVAVGSTRCGCPSGTYYDEQRNVCRQCTVACHPNATLSAPCGWGSTANTVTCTCKPGFAGDGIASCTVCSDPDQCVCAKSTHYDFVDIIVVSPP